MPVSRTATRRPPVSTVTVTTTSPSCVNLTALPTRLVSTWRSRPSSPLTHCGTSSEICTSSSRPALVRAPGQQVARVADRLAHVEVRRVQVQLAGLDLREVEDVVDDRQQRAAGAAHRLGERALLVVERRVQQQVGHAEHAVHRGADLVADVGHELGLQPRRLERLVARHDELGLRAPALHELAEEAGDRHHRRLDLVVARVDGVVEELEHAQARPVAHHRDGEPASGCPRWRTCAKRSSCCASGSHTSSRVVPGLAGEPLAALVRRARRERGVQRLVERSPAVTTPPASSQVAVVRRARRAPISQRSAAHTSLRELRHGLLDACSPPTSTRVAACSAATRRSARTRSETSRIDRHDAGDAIAGLEPGHRVLARSARRRRRGLISSLLDVAGLAVAQRPGDRVRAHAALDLPADAARRIPEHPDAPPDWRR